MLGSFWCFLGINNHNSLCVIIYDYLTETLHLKETYIKSNQVKYLKYISYIVGTNHSDLHCCIHTCNYDLIAIKAVYSTSTLGDRLITSNIISRLSE